LPNTNTIWHYISSPVSNATINTFFGSLLNSWNEPLNRWDTLAWPVTLPLVPGVGYSLAKHAPDGIVTFTGGSLNNDGSYSPTLTQGSSGWNLIGNPYPCAISWNLLPKTNVLGTVYTWNGTTKNYVSYNTLDGVGALTGGIIPSEQAFFIQSLAPAATCTIPSAARLHSATALYKNSVANVLTMKVKGNDVTEDYAFILFKPESTVQFDTDFDAYKLFGMEDAPQLYSITPTETLTINALPEIAAQPVIAMGLKVGMNDTYTFTASDLETFPSGTVIILEDLLASKVQDLNSNPVYTFAASPGDPVHRFNVHFAAVGVSENKLSDIHIYSAEKTIYVNIPSEMKGNIIVYNMLGREITRTSIQSHSLSKINLDAPTGFYLVKVEGDYNTSAGKVFIR
jgi:hypothetical protein